MIQLRHLLIGWFALLSMVQARADVEINETNFPDDNFRSYLLSNTYGSDGVITDAEIAGISYLFIYSRSIQSLKGIEYFSALTMLMCYNNLLTSLDVSKNTILKTLYCFENQLTSLDVSGCTVLGSLACGGNQLASLDVSKNTALQYLDCSINELTALDVSECTALTDLRCNQNQIKGAAMDALVASLPTHTSNMNVISNENEGNVMTTTQVAAAKAKGWTPMYYNGTDWVEYTGSDPTAIEAVESDALDSKNGSDVYFDLSGRRVMTPAKGVFVKNGHKVAIK